MSVSSRPGPGELGQNFLADRSVIGTVETLVSRTSGPIVELAAGDGALTRSLARLHRPVTAVELDPKRVRQLRRTVPGHVTVHNEDMLAFRFPRHPHVLVGNLPFHLTTAVLRRLLAEQHWDTAILLMQWEVARRRAGVGGATLLTASWWPWYEFVLHERVPARCFRPVPGVDAGLLTMRRRARPMVRDRRGYQRFVKAVFTGPGHGIREILRRTGQFTPAALGEWFDDHQVSPRALPKQLDAQQWAALWRLAHPAATPTAWGAPSARRGQRRSRPD